MAAVQSTMQALGSAAANFSLPDVRAVQNVSLADFSAQPLLVMFICNHCPFVIHIAERMAEVANQAVSDGFAVIAISSNDVDNYPQDGPEEMALFAQKHGFEFPYLYDESQAVAKAYGAACTPDFFIFDADHSLQYRGQMDSSRPGNGEPVTALDLSAALAAVKSGLPANETQVPSIGCNIKWKAGNAPSYFQ